MVVLAASVITKGGKALASRQFAEMTRVRIEGLLAAFPKLIESGKQHTYVETESVRYVYQPVEELYVVLITNKASNILEDIDTLRLIVKIMPEYVPSMDEEGVEKSSFELVFALDEVVAMGMKDPVTPQQVKAAMDMESHEEKLHKMIIESKVNETKDVMAKKAKEIDRAKIEKAGPPGPSAIGRNSSIAGGGQQGMEEMPVQVQPQIQQERREQQALKGLGQEKKEPSKGMQLGKGKQTTSMLESLKAEGEQVTSSPVKGSGASREASSREEAKPAPEGDVDVHVEEKVSAEIKADGALERMDVQGQVILQVSSEEFAHCTLHISRSSRSTGFQFKTHPSINRQLFWDQSCLSPRDSDKPFPVGNPFGVLKWRLPSPDESLLPISISCWPSGASGTSIVSLEYEANPSFSLSNVCISIPVPSGSPPRITQVDGNYRVDQRRGVLEWTIDLIDDSNSNGAFEFKTQEVAPESFFPIDVSFSSANTMADVNVDSVVRPSDQQEAKLSCQTSLSTDSFRISS